MKKIYSKEQLKQLKEYPIEVINGISETIEMLDDNYGANRDLDSYLGYILLAENIVVAEMLKQVRLKGLILEYTSVIEGSNGKNYTSTLFLLSNDFSILVVTTEELSNFLLEYLEECMSNKKRDVIKSTTYCNPLVQACLVDDDYTYCIERIYVKSKKIDEIRFSLYKDTTKSDK